jgi:vacuolar-type H+-ATPase subunit I/STV1
VPPASAHPDTWGRVDADGTVYLRTPEGERVIGSWQAGAPDEGLAHFARRFDDLLTEAELLAARLATGGSDPKHALSSARQLRDGLGRAAVVGDVAGLGTFLDALVERAEQAVSGARSAREASRARAVARKEELAEEAERLAADTTQWKQAGDRFKTILEEWRSIRGIDRKTDEQLWKRFSRARDGFNRRRGSHFAELDRQRATARTRKEELVAEAEALRDSTDWGATAARYKQLMADWKAAGRAQKDADDALWQRFRAAQEAFFTHRSSVFSERDAEFAANATRKEQLLVEAEQIDTANPDSARAALRAIHEHWEEAGKVPRERIRELEDRLRAVEDRIREDLDKRWRRSDPKVDARVAQFRERVAAYETQAAKARAAGDARRAQQAEGQAEQWREWLATAEKAVQR